MKKKQITISYRWFILLILLIIITITIINSVVPTLFYFLSSSTSSRIDSLISLSGNIIGGLIAGIVAYITAAYQVSKKDEQNNYDEYKKSYVEILLLYKELEQNEMVISSVTSNDDSKGKFLKDHLKDNQWERSSFTFINNVDMDFFNRLYNFYEEVDFTRINPDQMDDIAINNLKTLISNLLIDANHLIEEMKKNLE